MITILLYAAWVAGWPRRRAHAALQRYHYRAAERRTLIAECERLRDQRPEPFTGSMIYAADPIAREPGYLGTWTPHDEAWLAEHTAHLAAAAAPEDVPSTGGLPPAPVTPPAGEAPPPPVLGTYLPPSRLATADDWFDAMTAPDLARRLAAERGALDRWLERETARFHHERTMGGGVKFR